MSLVGPRPPLRDEVDRYESDAVRRLRVRPGMTGLWQVSGRSDLSWVDSVRLDLWYVDNWSLALDAQILVRTAKAVLEEYGKVYVKIRRDNRGMPYGFCQYEVSRHPGARAEPGARRAPRRSGRCSCTT